MTDRTLFIRIANPTPADNKFLNKLCDKFAYYTEDHDIEHDMCLGTVAQVAGLTALIVSRGDRKQEEAAQ